MASKNFIGGRFVAAASDKTMPVFEPATGRSYDQIADSDGRDVDAAVWAARTAFDEAAWGRTSALERGRMLSRLGHLILDKAAELAAIEARDTGKPISVADADIVALARYFEFYGGAADKLHGDIIPYLNGYLSRGLTC